MDMNSSYVSMNEVSGMRGLKQIYRSLMRNNIDDMEKEEVFIRHTHHFLNRCFPNWMK